MPCKTQVMVDWKHEMIISGLQNKMVAPVWAIIDEFGVNLSEIYYFSKWPDHWETNINEYLKRIEFWSTNIRMWD